MINELKANAMSIRRISRYLGFSRSWYYQMRSGKRKLCNISKKKAVLVSEEEIIKEIEDWRANGHIHWGYRRMWAYLRFRIGLRTSQKRVYRIMKEKGYLVEKRRLERNKQEVMMQKKPQANKPKEIWGIDMTKFLVPNVGWVYFVAVIDWYTKELVGYNIGLRSKSEQWKDALNMAINNKFSNGVRDAHLMLVSDNGTQPTSAAFIKETATLRIQQIFTSYNNPKGNADTERFMRTFKEEVIYTNDFTSLDEAVLAIENWISFYNNQYPHSSLGYMSPKAFEQNYYQNLFDKPA